MQSKTPSIHTQQCYVTIRYETNAFAMSSIFMLEDLHCPRGAKQQF